MSLMRIEIQGFKSFANYAELEIAPGITAVVGPNGSGKSNIADALRWALGEQSARPLRGGKMEDVIFAGSDAQKPVNYSEVTLTLDNSDGTLPLDFTEVTVTRRLYRSGESVYLLNRQPCRMRDISELLMDTGVGRDAYSIIGQGRIDEVLTHKPEERRAIFEEAAGIVRYRVRKKETEKRLYDTEQNLLRLADLLNELKVQLPPLQAQAEMARRYQTLQEALREQEICLYLVQIEEAYGTWQKGKAEIASWQKQIEGLLSQCHQYEAELEALRFAQTGLEEELEVLSQRHFNLQEAMEKQKELEQVRRERRTSLVLRQENLNDVWKKQQTRLQLLDERLANARVAFGESEGRLAGLKKMLVEKEHELEQLQAGTHLDKEQAEMLKSQYYEQMNALSNLNNDLRALQQRVEELHKRAGRLGLEKKEVEEKLRLRKLEEQALMGKKETLIHQGETLACAQSELHRSIQLDEEKLAQLVRRWEEWSKSWHQVVSRRDVLQEMKQDFAGYAGGPKEVLRARECGELTGIHGAVAELLRVPAHLELAIETALGSAVQQLVVDDEASGRQAIEYLKKKKAGRATFLPLDVIRPRRRLTTGEKTHLAGMAGFVGEACELVETDRAYQDVLAYLLGQVLVVETLEQANWAARAANYHFRVVTLEGDVVNIGGAMTGGSKARQRTSLFGRSRELDHLEQALTDLRREREQLEALRSEVERELAAQRTLQNKQQEETAQLAAGMQEVERAYQTIRAQQDADTERLNVFRIEKQEVQQEEEETIEHLKAKERSVQSLKQEADALRGRLETTQASERNHERALEEVSQQVNTSRLAAARLEEAIAGKKEALDELSGERALLLAETEEITKQLAQIAKELEESTTQEGQWQEKMGALFQEKEALAKVLAAKRQTKKEKEQQAVEVQVHVQQIRQNLRKAEENLHRQALQVERLDVQLDHLLNALAQDYEISYEGARKQYAPPENINDAEQEVTRLKKEMAQLGAVNLGAIEAFERLRERYEFLTNGQRDLLTARENLRQIIAEIEEKISQRFTVTFEAVNHAFHRNFSRLFGGGKAELIFTEPGEPLTTGVEILARPPGKTLQSLSLLSGGERAMTAIALLFAILEVKPVPFCVLDEVDAALDETNISRFTNYLREFSKETQFIVMTHRKGTMEAADVLYGVTMDGSGVSKVVSVRLTEEEEVKVFTS